MMTTTVTMIATMMMMMMTTTMTMMMITMIWRAKRIWHRSDSDHGAMAQTEIRQGRHVLHPRLHLENVVQWLVGLG